MRVLILNGDLPTFPGRAGHEYLNTTRLARLGNAVGLVSMVHTAAQRAEKPVLEEAGLQLFLWENPALTQPSNGRSSVHSSWFRPLARSIRDTLRSGLVRPRDTLIQDFQFRNLANPILEALRRQPWDVLVVIQSMCARWLEYLPRFPLSVLVLHDVRARVYERQAATERAPGKRLAYALEAWRYRRFEAAYCRRCDLVVTVSSADEEYVRRHYRPRAVLTTPIPVDGEYFAPLPAVPEMPMRIVFTGMMNHPPNVDAVVFFARDVLPNIQAAIPAAEFWIVGRDPTPEVQALAGLPGVFVAGSVPDIRPFVAQAAVVVVPLRFGAGMRNKILEAWAMERCIVSTSVGAEGLSYVDGGNLLIADGAAGLAETVIGALRDPHLRNAVRREGRALVLAEHHPDKIANQLSAAYHRALTGQRAEKQSVRAVIDLRWVRPGEAGGIENLSRSFLRHLLQLDRHNQYQVLVPAQVQFDFDRRGHSNVQIYAVDGLRAELAKLAWYGQRWLHNCVRADYWRSAEVESLRRANRWQADVALSTSGYIAQDMYPLRNVVVVPDLQHEYHPEFFSAQAVEERRRVFGDSIRRARRLIAISEYTRQSVLEIYRIAPEDIATAHLAADPLFEKPHPAPEAVLGKYRLPRGGYLFFPGHTWPHKNHVRLLEAVAQLRAAHSLAPLLVLTGSAKQALPEIRARIQELGLEAQVRFLGYCPPEDLPALYAGAAGLVYPSLFEGFGIPLVEAMWSGCPIVCANRTSLPEVAGDAALLVDPCSPEAMADGIERLLTDSALRATLVANGRRRAPLFSWRRFTLAAVAALRAASDGE